MADLSGRKVFRVFNQDFVVDDRYNVTKELGQGAYGIVWYVVDLAFAMKLSAHVDILQCRHEWPERRRCCDQESHECFQQEDFGKTCVARDKVAATLPRTPKCMDEWTFDTFQALTQVRSHVSTIWIFLDQTISTNVTCTKVRSPGGKFEKRRAYTDSL